jgi:uridine phosphorylase
MKPRVRNKPVINPSDLENNLRVTQKVLLVAGPSLWQSTLKYFNPDKNEVKDFGYFSLFNVQENKESFTVAGAPLGAPVAVMTLERLIQMGAKEVIMLGACGSINEEFSAGNIMIPMGSFSEEGTSHLYPGSKVKAMADRELTEKLFNGADQNQFKAKKGVVWTTDGFFRETREKVKKYKAMGADAVEMELSALFNVAKYRGTKLASVQIVSDELFNTKWKTVAGEKIFHKKVDNTLKFLQGFMKGGN